jgi:Fe-Mn family superoxide dismutase
MDWLLDVANVLHFFASSLLFKGLWPGVLNPQTDLNSMTIELPPLPYPTDALAPHISARTLEFHHGKHHKAYVDNTAAAIKGTALENADLPTIIRSAKAQGNRKLFNNSAQAWNHAFFWQSMKPAGGGLPAGQIAKRIDSDLGGYGAFRKAFAAEAVGHFAAGWAWLVLQDGILTVTSYHDADTPLTHGTAPILTLDVWEHAYYLDYQNARGAFADAFLDHLVNWEEAERRLQEALA